MDDALPCNPLSRSGKHDTPRASVRQPLRVDDRAQATGIANFFLALLIGAVVTWLVQAITNPLFDHAGQRASDPIATQTHGWLETFVGNLPAMFLFFSLFSLLALSVFQREVLR